MIKMKNIIVISVILSFFLIIHSSISSAEDLAKCGGDTCPVNPETGDTGSSNGPTCSDTDGYTNANGIYISEVYDTRGACTDVVTPNPHEDYCKNINILIEYYCSSCNGLCDTREQACQFGCNADKGICNTKEELLKGMALPPSGQWCIDGDGQDIPDPKGEEPIPLDPGGCDAYGDNGRTNYYVESFCIDSGDSGFTTSGKVNFDACDGGTANDYYCNDFGSCSRQSKPCKAGCDHSKCMPVPAYEGKLCLNPDSDILCDMKNPYSNLCCPDDPKNYPVVNGPLNYYDCLDNYFLTREPSAIDLDECHLVCCCEFYYDDENTKQIQITQDRYAMDCKGSDKIPLAIGSLGECTLELCRASKEFLDAIPQINDDLNYYLDAIKEGRGCKSGTCNNNLNCVEDLNIAGEKICCKELSCVNNGKCVFENTKAVNGNDNKEYICQNSKWTAVLEPGNVKKKGGCSKGSENSDAALVFAPLAFILLFGTRKILPKR